MARKGTKTAKPEYGEDWIFQRLHSSQALVIDEKNFDPGTLSGFQMDMDKMIGVLGDVKARTKGDIAVTRRVRQNCVMFRVGADGPAPGVSGADAVLIDPTLSNCLIFVFGGNGAPGAPGAPGPGAAAVGSGAAGQRGGHGGRSIVAVKDSNLIVAVGGRGGSGGGGQQLPGPNVKGGDAGDGGRGGNVVLVCQGNNRFLLVAGAGGPGDVGGDGGTLRAVPSVGNGGKGGDGGDGGTIEIVKQVTDMGQAFSGDGGGAGRAGRGNVSPQAGGGSFALGGDGGDGGSAGSINGGALSVMQTLGSPQPGANAGSNSPQGFLGGGQKGMDGRPGNLN